MGRRAALAALLITAAFIGVRAWIYALHPAIDIDTWTARDALMNWPRAAAIAATLAAMAAFGGVSRRNWRGLTSSFLPLAVVGAAQTWGAWHDAGPGDLTAAQSAAGLWANLFVVIWEEACYRGLLYLGLRERMKPLPAALLSSAAFMAMHWQAQPLWSWPRIFFYGVVACAALEGGTGLLWLMLVHLIVDSAFFLSGGGDPVLVREAVSYLVSAGVAAWAVGRLSEAKTRTAEA